MDSIGIAEQNQRIAWKVIEDTRVIPLWERIGAEVNLVGSLKSGLLMKNRDIDFHIYTEQLVLSESFSVIEQLAEQPGIREIQYRNLIDTEEACIEWHLWYEHPEYGNWKLDLIHILKGSRYDGTVERVTDTIKQKLTPELRKMILQIKSDIPDDVRIPGIEIYYAVFCCGVSTYKELVEWRKDKPVINYLEWMP